MPGVAISSATPETEFFNTSSIASKAFKREVFLLIIEKILSLEMAIKASTLSIVLKTPSSAILALS